ncbi:hypothetical protein [Portibacter lacus]|uniref:HNH endonuclease n=1 Tax=Portibacter lacus TaxID=1099794 RepID=A0AA37SQV8_9BACT|nr:hypothetical protein [Portibacter lacus]GLR16010.1 hypothetical protein GCM10007940_06250 [Portibacter lacus]
MKQIKKFSDSRLDDFCIYCGAKSETRDHVPSKIIMDEPFPKNLPVVPACDVCNQNFSQDEEYFSCLIECILSGTTEPEKLGRTKIRDILKKKPFLRARIEKAKLNNKGQISFQLEEERVTNVILKLARGHATYENSEPEFNDPASISIKPIMTMSEAEKAKYFSLAAGLFAEIGSRAFQRIVSGGEIVNNSWVVVQKDKYQYKIVHGKSGLSVKFIIWNYLACEVVWN